MKDKKYLNLLTIKQTWVDQCFWAGFIDHSESTNFTESKTLDSNPSQKLDGLGNNCSQIASYIEVQGSTLYRFSKPKQ